MFMVLIVKDVIYSSKLFLIKTNKEEENPSMSAYLLFNGFVFLWLQYSVQKTFLRQSALDFQSYWY